MHSCLYCGNSPSRKTYRYCSNQCQKDYEYKLYIQEWKLNKKSKTVNISHHIKKFLLEKYEERCSQCGWNQKNLTTGKVPLEIDHIDGNADNNIESNLRVLCPNCHSLTSNFRNLNKGSGRSWRRKRVSLI